MRRFILSIACAVLSAWILVVASTSVSAAEVSAKRALNNVMPEVKFDNVSISDAIDFLRDVSSANIHVNWRALEEIGVGKDTIRTSLSSG